MNGSETLDQVAGVGEELGLALAGLHDSHGAATDVELVSRLQVLGGILRLVEGALAHTVAEVHQRSSSADRAARMSTRVGCRTVAEVVERATGVSGRTARQWVRAAGMVAPATDLAGAVLPGLFPAVSEAARCGVIGLDGILAIAGGLSEAVPRVGLAAVQAAELFLVDRARGAGITPDVASAADSTTAPDSRAASTPGRMWDVHCPASDLQAMSQAVLMRIDPDGAEPSERVAMLKRGITLGAPVDGLIPIRGALLPETAAQLRLLLDAYNNPSAGLVPVPVAHDPERAPGAEVDPRSVDSSRRVDMTGGSRGGLGGVASGAVRFQDAMVTRPLDDGDVDGLPCECGACDTNAMLSASAFAEEWASADSHTAGPRPAPTAERVSCVCLPSRADDRRTAAQKRHDALYAMLRVAAESGRTPTLQGHAPTLLVRVADSDVSVYIDARRCADPADGAEYQLSDGQTAMRYRAGSDAVRQPSTAQAKLAGLEVPISLATAARITCAGGIQYIHYDTSQAITAISSEARLFTPTQRRAINDRDRECIIPGCHVAATWCEHHHVTEWADGGPTHTSNGVAICFHHHRTLEQAGWRIRMRDGVPEVQAPLLWDPHQRWIRQPHHQVPLRL